ncbi:helix-turn-helix domain-containing protein [Streptomyces sp. NPDC002499]
MTSDENAQPELTAQLGDALLQAFDRIDDVRVFVKDGERRFVACSEPFARLLGYRHPWQLFGLRDEDLSPEYLVEHYRGHDEQVLSTGEALIDLVELVRNPNGSYDWYLTTKTPIRPQGGTPIGIVGVTRALTKRDAVSRRLLTLTPAVELISREYTRALSVEELAASVSLSPSHFSRTFKAHFGATPHQYLRRVRLMAVCDLLAASDLPLSVIADRTGFYDQSHLSNEFKKERGVTPAEYRATHGNTAQAQRSRIAFLP